MHALPLTASVDAWVGASVGASVGVGSMRALPRASVGSVRTLWMNMCRACRR